MTSRPSISAVSMVGRRSVNKLFRDQSITRMRDWNHGNTYCRLCKESISSWNLHKGTKDHSCLEMFYNLLTFSSTRVWSPTAVWQSFQSLRLSFANSLDFLHREDDVRRLELLRVLQYLQSEGLLHLSIAKEFAPKGVTLNLQSVVPPALWKEKPYLRQLRFDDLTLNRAICTTEALVMTPLLRLFPEANEKQLSAVAQNAYGGFNCEMAFDICGMSTLLKPSYKRVATFTHKRRVMTGIIGELRHYSSFDNEGVLPAHLATLADVAMRGLLREMLFIKMIEYVGRVEPIWRQEGLGEIPAPALFESIIPPTAMVPPI
jgi:hypothetical protein